MRKSARATKAEPFPWATNAAAIALAVICVGAVMLIAAPRSRQPEDVEKSWDLPAPVQTNVYRAVTPSVTQATEGDETPAADEAPTANWPVMEPVEAQTASVTITGCVDHDDQRFRLKDTAGASAPKSRSWKSGFLRKGPTPIKLVDADNSLKLPTYVGHRVAATGRLVNRELQVHSLRWVANASCT